MLNNNYNDSSSYQEKKINKIYNNTDSSVINFQNKGYEGIINKEDDERFTLNEDKVSTNITTKDN